MKPALDEKVHKLLNEKLDALEAHFQADVLNYFGPFEGGENIFLKIIEELAADEKKNSPAFFCTPGPECEDNVSYLLVCARPKSTNSQIENSQNSQINYCISSPGLVFHRSCIQTH